MKPLDSGKSQKTVTYACRVTQPVTLYATPCESTLWTHVCCSVSSILLSLVCPWFLLAVSAWCSVSCMCFSCFLQLCFVWSLFFSALPPGWIRQGVFQSMETYLKLKTARSTQFISPARGALWEVELVKKCPAVLAPSTFGSQNVQDTPCSEQFWKLRWICNMENCMKIVFAHESWVCSKMGAPVVLSNPCPGEHKTWRIHGHLHLVYPTNAP